MSRKHKRRRSRPASSPVTHGIRSAQPAGEPGGPPSTNTRDGIHTRAAALAPDSLDENSRRVRSVLTTEDPVPVYDWESGRVVLEVLVVSGCEFESQLPLLRDHRQYSVDAILGSVLEVAAGGDELTGTLEFGRELDEETEAIWRRVAQGHLRRGSIGYRYTRGDYHTIPAGESAKIGGRTFTAPAGRALRVVTKWRLVEYSMVVIPADPRAQLRGESEPDPGTPSGSGQSAGLHDPAIPPSSQSRSASPVNPLIDFLRGLGLADDVTDVTAAVTWARANLNAAQLGEMQTVATRANITLPPDQNPPPTPGGVRNTPTPPNPGSGQVDPIEEGRRQERERIRLIRELAGEDVPAEVVTRAEQEGWDVARATEEFLRAVRHGRSNPVPATPPAGHVGGGQATRESLTVGLLARHGIEPGHQALQSLGARTMLGSRGVNSDFICRGGSEQQGLQRAEAQAIQEGHRYAGASFDQIARECLRMEGIRAPFDQDEMFERALTSANFSAVLGTLINALVLVHYEQYPDTTTLWTRRNLNVPDFRDNQRIRNTAAGRMQKMAKNQHKADHMVVGDPVVESYAIERTAGKVVIDERVFINDSLDVLEDTPQLIGESARAMVPDAVYGHLVANGNMADGTALFHASRGNLNTGSALASDTLEAGRAGMATQTENGRTLGIQPQYLIVPEALAFTARQLVNSEELRDNGDTAAYGTSNPHKGRFQVVPEGRLDNGGYDPLAEADFAASTSSWYLGAGQARHTVEVGFRKGTNGMPRIRRKVLDGDAYGMLFSIVMDFGVKALSPAGLQKNNA